MRRPPTDALPLLDATEGDAQACFAFGRDRVEEAPTLDKTAVAGIARVGGDEVIERKFVRAATGESENDHVSTFVRNRMGQHGRGNRIGNTGPAPNQKLAIIAAPAHSGNS